MLLEPLLTLPVFNPPLPSSLVYLIILLALALAAHFLDPGPLFLSLHPPLPPLRRWSVPLNHPLCVIPSPGLTFPPLAAVVPAYARSLPASRSLLASSHVCGLSLRAHLMAGV